MADAATLRDYALDNFDKNTAETRRRLNEYKKEYNEKFGKGSAKEILDDLLPTRKMIGGGPVEGKGPQTTIGKNVPVLKIDDPLDLGRNRNFQPLRKPKTIKIK